MGRRLFRSPPWPLATGPQHGGVYFGLLAGSLFWGTSFAAAKIGLRELSPLNLMIARFGLASVLFAVFPQLPDFLADLKYPRFSKNFQNPHSQFVNCGYT